MLDFITRDSEIMQLKQNLNTRQKNRKDLVVENKWETIRWSKGNNRMTEQCCPVRNKNGFFNVTRRGTVLFLFFVPVLPISERANAFSYWINSAADLYTSRLQRRDLLHIIKEGYFYIGYWKMMQRVSVIKRVTERKICPVLHTKKLRCRG